MIAGTDRLSEIYEQNSSHPPSGESSARQTPQPAPQSHNKEVQAAFAKQVMQAINTDNESVHIDEPSNHQEPAGDHIEQLTYPPPLQQAVQSSNTRLDNIVQSSNLKVSGLCCLGNMFDGPFIIIQLSCLKIQFRIFQSKL